MSATIPDQPPEDSSGIIEQSEHSRTELIQTYNDLKKQLRGFHKESMQMFEEWITQIYCHRMKTADIYFMDGIEINVTSQTIERIIRRILADVCETHKEIIGEQMRFMLEAGVAEHYYKVDADVAGVGFFDSCVGHEWVTEADSPVNDPQCLKATTRLNVNYQYYEYCVWVIYHHYCSLSDSNKQVCLLVETIRQNSQAEFYSFYREMEAKRMIAELEESVNAEPCLSAVKGSKDKKQQLDKAEKLALMKLRASEALNFNNDAPTSSSDYLYSPSYEDLTVSSSTISLDRMADLIDEYDLVRESELNILTITNLIPLAMPKIDTNDKSLPDDYIFSNSEQENYEQLYQHINKFEQTINNIVNKSKQNMRKHCAYLEEFRRAIVILRGRLKNIRHGHHKKRALQRQQQHQKFLQQQLLMEEQYKDDVSRELDRELRAASKETSDWRKQVEEANIVRNIDKNEPSKRSAKIKTEDSTKKPPASRTKSQEVDETAVRKNSNQNSNEQAQNENPLEFGDTESLFLRQKNAEASQWNKFSFPKLEITPNHSLFDSLLRMGDGHDTKNISKKTVNRNTESGESVITTTMTATNGSQSKQNTTIFKKLEKKLKMLIDRDSTNGEEFDAVMSRLSGISKDGLNKNEVKSGKTLREESLVFTKTHLEKSKFLNNAAINKQELKFTKFRHLNSNASDSSSYRNSQFDGQEIGLHEFIETQNLRDQREDDDNQLDEMDEDYLERQEEQQRMKKKDKRKRNKKKKKEQQQILKKLKQEQILCCNENNEQSNSEEFVIQSLKRYQSSPATPHECTDEIIIETPKLQKAPSRQISTSEDETPESRVIRWLRELSINDSQREGCYPIPSEVMHGWQKMASSRSSCNRGKLISLSVTPKKKSRSKKGLLGY